MTDFTRVTIIGSSRRATLVLPSDEPVTVLLPDIADLLAEPPTPEPSILVSNIGEEVVLSASLSDQGIVNGTILRLFAVAKAPAPPEVSDVTDTVAEQQDAASRTWNATHRAAATAVALGAMSFILTHTVSTETWLSPTVFAVSGVLAVVLGWTMSPRVGFIAVAPALGAVPGTAAIGMGLFPGLPSAAIWPLTLGLAWLVLGVAGSRRASLGGALGVLLAVIPLVLTLFGAPVEGVAAVVAVCVTLALGALPSVALAVAGVTKLDDDGMAGTPVARTSVLSRVADAYGMFTWAVAAAASFGAWALATLISSTQIFAGLLGIALALALALRTRVMPHAVQAWVLWASILAGLVAVGFLPHHWSNGTLLLSVFVCAVVIVLLGTIRPRLHTRVRWRRFGDVLESLAALSMLPLTLGAFDVYEHLLAVFG